MKLEEYLESLWLREEKTLSEMNKMFSWIEDITTNTGLDSRHSDE